MDRFWQSGYAGTSLDELCAETGMNRSSHYAAFGDKHTLDLKALEHYWQQSHQAMRSFGGWRREPEHSADARL